MIRLNGAPNFRDLGGIATQDNKTIKFNKLFRSDDLSALTEEDLKVLSDLPLVSIVDFRSDTERNTTPDIIPSCTNNVYEFSMEPGNFSNISKEELNNPEENASFMMKGMYEALVSDSKCVEYYKQFFRLLQDEKNLPLVFHCAAGKDRTGIGAALILYSLGVEESVIMENYLLSNQNLEQKYSPIIKMYPEFRTFLQVRTEYLYTAFNRIIADHGSIENFLTKVLDVDFEKMKAIYLE